MKKWTKDFPKNKGMFWFYGWERGLIGSCETSVEEPKLILVKCRKTANGANIHIGNGQFIFPEEATGVWKEFEGIETPKVEELRKIVGDEHNEVF